MGTKVQKERKSERQKRERDNERGVEHKYRERE